MLKNCLLFAVLLCFSTALTLDRKLEFTHNPGCGDKCANITGSLIHVAASGHNDTIHHIWDFIDKPTVFLALTPLHTNFSVDWDRFLNEKSHSWSFSSEPYYVFALVINNIIEYNDLNDTAKYNSSTNIEARVVPSESFNWTWSPAAVADPGEVASLMIGTLSNGTQPGVGQIQIKLSAYGYSQHGNVTPHLYHSSNATQLDVVFDQMPTSFNHSRYTLDLGVFYTNQDFELRSVEREQLNDEHSPGVFSVSELLTTNKEDYSGYMQWRKVDYTSPERNMINSSETTVSAAWRIQKPSETFKRSGVFAYYGKKVDHMAANNFFINFGTRNDGYYGKTRLLSWTFLVGIGKPLEDSFSLLIWLVLGFGLGLPALLALISAVCIVSQRIQRTRDQLLAGQ